MCLHPLSTAIETPTERRGGCSRMSVSPMATLTSGPATCPAPTYHAPPCIDHTVSAEPARPPFLAPQAAAGLRTDPSPCLRRQSAVMSMHIMAISSSHQSAHEHTHGVSARCSTWHAAVGYGSPRCNPPACQSPCNQPDRVAQHAAIALATQQLRHPGLSFLRTSRC